MSGCLKVGPDFKRPDPAYPLPEAFQHTSAALPAGEVEDRWWEAFGDPDLDRLVEEVLADNLDIRQATATILEVQARHHVTRADRLPTLDAMGEARRQKQPNLSFQADEGDSEVELPEGFPSFSIPSSFKYDSYTFSLPASFELDLWGRLARTEEAARAELLRTEEARRTLTQTLVAEAVNLYLRMTATERRITIAEENLANLRRSLAIVEGRYERGLTSVLDVRQARRTLAQGEAVIPALYQDLGILQQNLAVLAGRYPETRPPATRSEMLRPLPPLPRGLPSEVLLRRPDIRAAEAALVSLNAQVGVAKASRFPRIALTATFGFSSDDLSRLFRPESELYNMAAGIMQPLFYAGKLKAAQRAAEARYVQGAAEYAKAVLTAFADVETGLLTRRAQMERRERMLRFFEESRATQEVAEKRYERGLVDYLTVLEAQQVRFQAEDSLALVDLAVLSNQVSLVRALGGGWGELPAVEKPGVRAFLDF